MLTNEEYDEVLAAMAVLPEQLVLPKYRTEWHDFLGVILVDCVESVIGRKVTRVQDWDEDLKWITSEANHPFTFEWICRTLDLNHRGIREIALKYACHPSQRKAKTFKRPRVGVDRRKNKGGRPRLKDTPERAKWRKKKNALHSKRSTEGTYTEDGRTHYLPRRLGVRNYDIGG